MMSERVHARRREKGMKRRWESRGQGGGEGGDYYYVVF